MDSQPVTKTLKENTVPVSLSSSIQENGRARFTSDDTEISIFDAHKYFNETNDSKPDQTPHDSPSVPRFSSVSSVYGYSRNAPTASSEASWNSQTGLLGNPPRSIGVSLNNFSADHSSKWISVAKKWFLGIKCCCNGEKSVQVNEVITSESEKKRPVVLINTSENMSKNFPSIADNIVEIHHIKAMDFSAIDAPLQQRISASGKSFIDGAVGFTFPILNPSSDQPTKTAVDKTIVNPTGDRLLEGFLPNNEVTSVENPSSIARDDDVGSEASSDLFEIESFSTQTASYPTYCRRDSTEEDQMYNARRFVSANEISDNQHGQRSVEEPPPLPPEREGCPSGDVTDLRPRQEEARGGAGKRKCNGLMLMSCRQEKAVGVGLPVVKCTVEAPPMFPLHVGGRATAGK